MNKTKLITSEESVWIHPKTRKEMPMSEMTDAQLRQAKKYAQAKVLKHHNIASKFDVLVDLLEDEAHSRGVDLEDYDREFFKNEKTLKSKISVKVTS